MPVKFDFVSPGILLREIDLSVLEPVPEKDGILLIGRARSGPAMRPVKVNNLNDFVDIFGNPMDGVRQSDPWRFGNTGAPNYAAYAAQAYLAAGTGPVKFIRLLGKQKSDDANEVAGWALGKESTQPLETNKTAMGLFLFPSSSATFAATALNGIAQDHVTGTLAAIFYCDGATPLLTGKVSCVTGSGTESIKAPQDRDNKGIAGALVESSADGWTFDLSISSSVGVASALTHSVSFDPSNPNYIRNVLNTDPTLFYASAANYKNTFTDNTKYFLGETFEANVSDMVSSSAGDVLGVILALTGTTHTGFDSHEQEMTAARTGWFIGPRQGQADQKKLFYLTALSEGVELQREFYVQISDCKLGTAPTGRSSFTLSIMKRDGNNGVPVEVFSNLSLDPTDDDYIVKRIGDFHEEWNALTGKFNLSGLYPNMSDYVRVTTNPENLPTALDLPIGFVGPKAPPSITVNGRHQGQVEWITGVNKIPLSPTGSRWFTDQDDAGIDPLLFATGALELTFEWPKMKMTSENSKGPQLTNYLATDVFGLRHTVKGRNAHSDSLNDLAHRRTAVNPFLEAGDALSTASIVFTLDDIRSGSTISNRYFFDSGSYGKTDRHSISSLHGLTGSNGLFTKLRIKQFAAPFFGGAEGLDIRYADPFSNARIDQSGNGFDRYPEYTIRQAIDMVADRDNIRYELISMPGIIDDSLNSRLMLNSSNRGDNLAIVDFSGIYQPGYDREDDNLNSNILSIVNKLETEQVDNSYAATYFPNVRLRDTLNGNDTVLIVPPSVAAIGAIAKSEAMSQPWFAPAGFNRGGLSRLGGSLGPIVLGTVEHLTKAERDQLYAAHINPIARFPATGDTVIFGQRTLQQAASALDRINVRRLLIYLKKHIGDIADTILFDQNVEATWNRFKARADAVLSEVKTELGITEYKLILDNTTTTPDLIDRNILYAKIFIKPARAIEFIAIDFIITKTGVEFE